MNQTDVPGSHRAGWGAANARGAWGRILARDATFAAPEPISHMHAVYRSDQIEPSP
jgi:hypothetical protein